MSFAPIIPVQPSLLYPVEEVLLSPPTEPSWLVPEIFAAGNLVVLAGEAGAGKSLTSYAMCQALATGSNFLGRDLPQKRVLYFDQENAPQDLNQYLKWVYVGLGSPDAKILAEHFKLVHFQLGDLNWASRARTDILACQPDLVVFDTATPCMSIEDENDNAEAARTINVLRALQGLIPGLSILIIKHAKIDKDPDDRQLHYSIRGAKTWISAVDSVMYQTKRAGQPRHDRLHNTKLFSGKTRAFGLKEEIKIRPAWTPDQQGIVFELD
jgi:RecA-family ATPase